MIWFHIPEVSAGRQASHRGLVIFDMDKTLVDVSRHHVAAYRATLQTVFGVDGEPDYRVHPGNMQPYIMRAICLENGVPERIIDERLDAAMDGLAADMRARLDTDLTGDILPGVVPLLKQLRRRHYALALATGTISRTAAIVLDRTGLGDYFPARAFGNEVEDRESLLRLAAQRASQAHGLALEPGGRPPLVVVGDAPRDIQAGRAVGARVIAVATGYHSLEHLSALNPDVLLPSLADWRAALGHIQRG